ncbi:MAG: Ig-like domain-containing protein [Clostridia bacterium]|nr:Ig-like domain-containing protein [Clostridia bacterium]
MRKYLLLVLCLALSMLAVTGLADEKERAILDNDGPKLFYDSSVEMENMSYTSGWMWNEIYPAEKYDLKLKLVDGNEAVFKTISVSQNDPESFYIIAKYPPETSEKLTVQLLGESETAYIDEIFEIIFEPYPVDKTISLLTEEVHIDVWDSINVVETFFGELPDNIESVTFEVDGDSIYGLDDLVYTAENEGIYTATIDLYDRNVMFTYNVQLIAGNPQDVEDATSKRQLSVNSYTIRSYQDGAVLYCPSDTYSKLNMRYVHGYYFSLSEPVNLKLNLELVEGDSFIKDIFSIESRNDHYLLWESNLNKLTKPGQATLRIAGENDEYFVDETFPVTVVPYEGPDPELSKSYIQVDLESMVTPSDMFGNWITSEFTGYSISIPTAKNGEYERIENSSSYVFHKKGIYRAVFEVYISNIKYAFDVNIYAGEYPYLLSADAGAIPGTQVQITAEQLMLDVRGKDIEYRTDGNDLCTIDENGLLSIDENATGSVTISAKPADSDIEASELKLNILGYSGNKEESVFSETSAQILDAWETAPFYITPADNWGYWNSIGTALELEGGEKVTKITVIPAKVNPGREKLMNVQKNMLYVDQSMLYDTVPESATFFVVAEGQKHYAQRILTIQTERVPDDSSPEVESTVFVRPGDSVNLYDYILNYPDQSVCYPMIESDKRDIWTNHYSHENGKKNVDLTVISADESVFTAYDEGRYPITYSFAYDNITSYAHLVIICSDTLKEDDFAFTIEGGEISAGQKLTIEPLFANPDLVNAKAKNNGVSWSAWLESDSSFSDVVSIQKTTVTAKQNISSLEELTITYTSEYCPSQSATATVYIHPKASGIEASIENDQLFLYPGMESTQIYAAAVPDDAIQRFVYKSSDPKVATVDENGIVTAVASGKTSISVSVDDGSQKKMSFNVTVVVPVSSIELNASDTTVQAGRNRKITAVFTPDKPTNKKVTWSLADSELSEYVKIDKEGNLSVKNDCPSGEITVIAIAEGSLPEEEVTGELVLTIVGKDKN